MPETWQSGWGHDPDAGVFDQIKRTYYEWKEPDTRTVPPGNAARPETPWWNPLDWFSVPEWSDPEPDTKGRWLIVGLLIAAAVAVLFVGKKKRRRK